MRTPNLMHRGMLGSLLVTSMLTACTSWRVEQVSPEQLFARQRPKAVRVERADRSRVVLNTPYLVADSLVGTSWGGPTPETMTLDEVGRDSGAKGQRTGVPLTDISQLAVPRTDALKTSGLILGSIAVPFALLGIAMAGSSYSSF